MIGESNLDILLKTLTPVLNTGDYVFCTVTNPSVVDIKEVISFFKEGDSYTLILNKEVADALKLGYSYIASWITLNVHSSLQAVGLTAAFSKALADEGLSCNVVAAYYHDHIFVDKKDAEKAMAVLQQLSK
jgi:uncharacterized protein